MSERNDVHRVKSTIRDYLRGSRTAAEVFDAVVDHCNRDNIAEALADAPPEALAELHRTAETFPHSDDEWATARFYYIGSSAPYKAKQDEATLRAERSRLRAGVEALREYFRSTSR
jgi:hypothetical protein